MENVELTDEELAIEKQKIIDGVTNGNNNDEDVILDSEKKEDKKYAGVYENVEELKKGITSLGATLPDYIIDGMSDDALEQYYIDLRKDFSSKPKEETPKEESPKEEPPKEKEAKKIIGDDLWSELDKEFAEKGGLSDEYYDKLEKLGIPNTVVDKYIDGIRSENEKFTNSIYELAGGEEQYASIKAWAEENYTQEELDAIASGSKTEILFKMKAVKAEYESKTSPSDRLVGGSKSNVSGYASQQDYLLDVMSPEYKKNAKYKAKVEAKFKASSFYS